MKKRRDNCSGLPYWDLVVTDNRVTEVSEPFLARMEFHRDEILGQDIVSIWKLMLKVNVDFPSSENPKMPEKCFLFTKSCKLMIARIIFASRNSGNDTFYFGFKFSARPVSKRMESLFNIIEGNIFPAAVFSVPDLTLLEANEKYLELNEEPFNHRENILGCHGKDFLSSWLWKNARQAVLNLFKTGKPMMVKEIQCFSKDREIFYLNFSLLPIQERGQVTYLASIVEDVTIRVLAANQVARQVKIMHQQKEQLEAIMENMSDGLYIVDAQGCFSFMNAEMRRYHDQPESIKSLKDVLNHNKYFDMDGNEMLVEEMPSSRVLRGETVKNMLFKIRQKNKEIIVDVNASPVRGENGEITKVVVNCRDITVSVKQAQIISKQKEELERMVEVKDEFFSLISHEFKTPITVITSAVQAMESICRDTLPPKALWFTEKIKQNALRQLRLVNNLLDYTRVNAGRLNVYRSNVDIVFLTRAITDSVKVYAQQKKVNLVFQSSLKKKDVGLDDEKFERILLNLLSNAIKFTPPEKGVTVSLSVRKGWVRVQVRDEGIGIPEDKLDKIFERFVQVDNSLTRKTEGTGIGLSLVKMLLESLGGTISVKSKLGVGSTFSVSLPAEKVTVEERKGVLTDNTDNRLIHATAVEFSDIYLN